MPNLAALTRPTAAVALAAALLTLPARDADACGCFAPPDPSVPIVQAGERIVFAHDDGVITAHIQIQYQGTAEDFGWLLPLPSVPVMKLGVEELFSQLIATTQPKYRLTRVIPETCTFSPTRGGPFAPNASADSAGGGGVEQDGDDESPVVIEDSIGPYDYAVLKADSRDEMFTWLADNRYFVPTGTEDVVGPYIRAGAYFLALKLRKGNDAGDIQPVVLEYASDLPMIPIILTSVAASSNMGIQVWVLGEHRAIPHNYRHTVINEEHIDWLNAGANYNDVIIEAVDEASKHHAFVTEYAGTSDVMKDVLDYDGRFGARATLEAITDPSAFVTELRRRGFPWTSTLVATLTAAFPMPQGVRDAGIGEEEFYGSLEYYLGAYRSSHPEQFEGLDTVPEGLAASLWERIVEPTLAAAALVEKYPKMTRLYTTLSPDEMTEDPVFAWNPDLPDVSNVHEATLTYICGFFQDGPANTPATLKLPDGREFYLEKIGDWAERITAGVPFSRRIEILRQEGDPIVEVDNAALVSAGDAGPSCACTATEPARSSGLGALVLGVALVLGRRRRRTR
ncbi:DUF2330 domain-containing protein [Myxococcota bacterium]|nr:DUF2330 domain-containing protein [Myxococcota bacterium]